ncbi:hypothetical protein NDU88_001643 [Pleurodeles waltl]|uniref:KRAB domain-containing protein n=1 Tax=Pleurodeles waltl TaxID=8319 RepID=A0AAV7SBE7_PLEWA|nr:hypothetical protein NDU88_001643 [Pleurodeles waltl]
MMTVLRELCPSRVNFYPCTGHSKKRNDLLNLTLVMMFQANKCLACDVPISVSAHVPVNVSQPSGSRKRVITDYYIELEAIETDMPRKNSDESQVVFIDAPAHFSKEEWKLLEEWQKDLYRNVMKEIHQALMSLGPLIASTVCSLRDKEREEIYHRDSQLSERRSKINRLTSDRMKDSSVLFRTSNTQSLHLNNTQDWEEKETADCPVTEFPFIDAETGLSKEEPVPIFIDHLGLEITENGTNPNSGASCNIKEEEDCYYMEQTDSGHAESLGCFTDNEGNNRQKKVQDSIKYSEKPVSSRAFSRKYNTKVPQSSVKEQISKSQVLSEYFQELIEEKATQSTVYQICIEDIVMGLRRDISNDDELHYVEY